MIANPNDPASTAGPESPPGVPWRWAANTAYAALLVAAAVLPPDTVPASWAPPDWLAHGLAYGVQSVLLFWALRPSIGLGRALVGGVAGAFAFGLVTEALQLARPHRSVELRDLIANGLGAVVACAVVALIAARRGGGRA